MYTAFWKSQIQDDWVARLEECIQKKTPTNWSTDEGDQSDDNLRRRPNKVAKRKSHDRGQIDRHSTGHPEIKWACAKEAPRRSPLYSKGRS